VVPLDDVCQHRPGRPVRELDRLDAADEEQLVAQSIANFELHLLRKLGRRGVPFLSSISSRSR